MILTHIQLRTLLDPLHSVVNETSMIPDYGITLHPLINDNYASTACSHGLLD